MDERFVERVLQLVEAIPLGRVLTYGRIGEILADGYGPRYVGRVMSLHGHTVPWWRVVRVDGTLAGPLMGEAQHRWVAEETPVRRGRVDVPVALWEPSPQEIPDRPHEQPTPL